MAFVLSNEEDDITLESYDGLLKIVYCDDDDDNDGGGGSGGVDRVHVFYKWSGSCICYDYIYL